MVQKIIFLVFFIFNQIAFADCDWKTISKANDGYLYSRDCHIEVGRSLEELSLKKQQVDLFRQSSDSFRQAYELEKQRSDLWYKEAQDLEKTYRSQRNFSDLERYAYFALGVFAMYGAVQAVK